MRESVKRYLCRGCYAYLKLLEKTVRLETAGPTDWLENSMIGFWHEDSFIMNLLLKKYGNGHRIFVVVTADERGEYIEYVLRRCHGNAIRIPDGGKCRKFLKGLFMEASIPGHTVAAAMDGPLGPRRVPKTLLPHLSEKTGKKMVTISVEYSQAVSLKRRWDHYKIPLPFTTVRISTVQHGVAERKKMRDFTSSLF